MSFGFAVGDFIAVGKLIADITSSLQTIGGAKSEYQELIREFESLDAALRRLDRLSYGSTHASVVDSIKCTALTCRFPLEQFMKKIKKLDKSLGIQDKSSRVKAVSDKLRWTFGHGDEIRKVQGYLNVHIGTINLLLAQHGLERADLNSKKADADAQQIRKQLDANTAILENVDKGLSGQTLLLRGVHSMLGNLYSFVSGDVQTSVENFCQVINRVCVSTQQIYAVVLDIRDSLLDTRWTYFQACVKVEDALGISFSVPAECDYYMLVTIIERKFETGIGAADVEAGNYELCLTQKRSELITAETRFMPGIAITMAIIISTSTASYGACPMPYCGSTKSSAILGGALVCSSCGVKYNPATKKPRRVEEVHEENPITTDVTMQAASHCDTCTCCRPKKMPKAEPTRSEPVGALKNVCWALAEQDKDPMTQVPEMPTHLNDGQQAHAAYKKGKPTHVFPQAAAFYAQEGRNYNAGTKAMTMNSRTTEASLEANGMGDSAVTILPTLGETNTVQMSQEGSDFSFELIDRVTEWLSNDGSGAQPSLPVSNGTGLTRPINEQYSVSGDFLSVAGPPSPTVTDIIITASQTPALLQCPENGCDAEFRGEYRRGNLHRHLRLKHAGAERLYHCEAEGCGRSFRRQDARLKHYRNRHPALQMAPAQPRPRSRRPRG